MTWVLFIAACTLSVGGLVLPLGLVILFLYVFFLLYELPETLMVLIKDECVMLSLYLYAMMVSAWRAYKFDVFKVGHLYLNGDNLYDNTVNVGDKIYDNMKRQE